jgi:hypothetical protein
MKDNFPVCQITYGILPAVSHNSFKVRLFDRKVVGMKLTRRQQPERVVRELQRAEVSHNATILATLQDVQVVAGVPYFCNSILWVTITMSEGDGGQLPEEVDLTPRIKMPLTEGFVNLQNVVITVNGAVQIKATNDTVVTPAS